MNFKVIERQNSPHYKRDNGLVFVHSHDHWNIELRVRVKGPLRDEEFDGVARVRFYDTVRLLRVHQHHAGKGGWRLDLNPPGAGPFSRNSGSVGRAQPDFVAVSIFRLVDGVRDLEGEEEK